MTRPLITVFTPCYNEAENIERMCITIRDIFQTISEYDYEHLIIDNHSTDTTRDILRRLALADTRIKVIFNTRNFGHIRSSHYGFLQARGDAVIAMASDFQDPPDMIPQFLEKWREGHKMVVGIKSNSEETPLFFLLRKTYYSVVSRLAEYPLNQNHTGFGLYDQSILKVLRTIEDPYPYFRGLICDLGYSSAKIEFKQPRRVRGVTKNNFYTLYDIAMLGFTSHSKVPLRLAAMLGFATALLSLGMAFAYLLYKLLYWDRFTLGLAPLIIGIFFFSSVQLFFIGILGEYIGAIHTQVLKRPLVVEQERINF
jgi:glycosyltransferase involved in cell wall biosynthesis